MSKSLHIWLLAFVAAAILELGWLHLAQPAESALSDAMIRTQARALQPDPDIVIVDIDEASLARLQGEAGSWPWPRAVYAELIEGLEAQQPQAIVFDLLFSEKDLFRPESDEAMLLSADPDSPNLPASVADLLKAGVETIPVSRNARKPGCPIALPASPSSKFPRSTWLKSPANGCLRASSSFPHRVLPGGSS